MDELIMEEQPVTSMPEGFESKCWGCGLRLVLPAYAHIFKCGWCGAVTNENQRVPENQCSYRWRRLRDRILVTILVLFMFFVIGGGVWAVYPVLFSFGYFCGIFHSIIAFILSITTLSSFSLAAFRSAGAPPSIIWGSYPVVSRGGLENYTFCVYCAKPKSPSAHHCRSCGMCVLDMDHHCPFEQNQRCDMLSRFLESRKEDLAKNSDRYLRDIILNIIIAGKDTTAATLSWFFYMLCKYPTIQEKIAAEVMEATGQKPSMLISEFAENVTEEALNKMHYLHAALTETLRLYPAVPIDAKLCHSDDILPDGFHIKKGDAIFFSPYAMGRMEFLWGEDAEEFKPERWLDCDGTFRHESPFKFTAFQAGPRICLGKEFAYRQMKIFAAVLLHYFVFKLSDEKQEVKYKTMLTLHMDGGLHLRAFNRYSHNKSYSVA